MRPVLPTPRSIVALLLDGILDARLAATLWLLAEHRVPVIVAAGEPISPTVLETARRHGLLHRLEATFG